MLLVLMYHRIGEGKYSNALSLFKEHLDFILDHYPVVMPGESLVKYTISLCLTFDDALCDFYHYVYPLLVQKGVRALLGVPVQYIQESTTLSMEQRLSIPHAFAMQEETAVRHVPFCTWEEIAEMQRSGTVEVASHSYSHCNLVEPGVDLERELFLSKALLTQRLGRVPETFIYPYGSYSTALHGRVLQEYRYGLRIGGALNFSWNNRKTPLCRIPADGLYEARAPLQGRHLLRYFFKGLLPSLR